MAMLVRCRFHAVTSGGHISGGPWATFSVLDRAPCAIIRSLIKDGKEDATLFNDST
jgi:hypothetical protein